MSESANGIDLRNYAGPVAQAYEHNRAAVSVIVGPTGGGKSQASARRILRVALMQHPSPRDGVRKCRITCVAPTYRILWDTAIQSYLKVFPKTWGKWMGAQGDPASHIWRANFGGQVVHVEVIFRALRDESAEEFVRGRETTGWWFPEMDTMAAEDLLSLAINRQLIVDRILDGSGTPASQFLPSRFDGTSTKLKVDPYDLEKAKALLKEAGYANGFKITLHATGDRYPKDKDIAQAVGQSWTRLGLQVAVEAVPGTVFFTQATKQEYSIFMAQYGTEEASIGPRALVHTPGGIYGTANRTKFSHTDIDAAIEKAQAEMDPVKRKPLVQAAIEIAMNEQAIIPVFHPNSEMASKANIAITPRPERRFNALMMKPKA